MEESSFAAHFSKLKKSERYETLEEACRAASELDAPNLSKTSDKNQSVGETSNSAASKPVPKSGSSNAILVSPKQRGNPLLKSIINVPWEYDESIVPDYVMGRTTCALFLSLRYHNLKPDYIAERLKLLGKLYDLRVLLVQVDQKDPHHALKHLTRICLLADLTLMLAWSAEEAGKIIETYKIFQNKPPDMIMERKESDPHVKLVSALSSVRPVNRTDATNLLSTFGSLKRIINVSENALSLCPGFGSNKASRLHKLLHQPFLKTHKPTSKCRTGGITKFLKSSDS